MEPEVISEPLLQQQSASFISSETSRTSLKSPKDLQLHLPSIHDSKRTRPLPDRPVPDQTSTATTTTTDEVRATLISKISPSSSSGYSRTRKEMMVDDLLHEADLFNEMSKNQARVSDESSRTNRTPGSRTNSLLRNNGYTPSAEDSNYETGQSLPMKRIKNDRKSNLIEDEMEADLFLQVPNNCAEQAEQFGKYVWKNGWKAMPHHVLPDWLRDNDYLLKGHRPPMPSTIECFKSIFRIHTETGNIWTHLIGALSFVGIAIYFITRPQVEIQLQEKIVFGAFFFGAITCLMCSALFHTFYCYSPTVSVFFNKIDYCGISILTIGSFVPWLYYAFYCESVPKLVYLVLIGMLGFSCIVVSMWDKFREPDYRALRAGMFIALGLSGVIPAIHYSIVFGGYKAFNVGALGWLILMAILYIVGASLYAARIPESIFPGRFDIWFQSHQIFHVFVVTAAYVHYHGITKLASYRLTLGDCLTAHIEADFAFEF